MDNQPQPDMNNYEWTDQSFSISAANTENGLHNYDKTDQTPALSTTYTPASELSCERTDQTATRPTTSTEAYIHSYAGTDHSSAWLNSYSLTDLNNSNQGFEDSFVDVNENITEEDSLPGLLGSGAEHEDVTYPMFSTDTVEDSGLWSTLSAVILEEDERDIHIDQELTNVCTDMASLRKQTTAVTVSNGDRKSIVRSSEYSALAAVQTSQDRYTAEGKENQSVTGHQSLTRSVSSNEGTHHPGPSGDSSHSVLTDKKIVSKRHSAPPKASSSNSNTPGGEETEEEQSNSFVSSVFTAFNEVSQKYHGPEFEKQAYINDGIATAETEDSFSEEIRYNRNSGQSVTIETAPRSPKVKHTKSEDLGSQGRPALVKAYHSVTCTPDDAPKVVTRSLVEQTEKLKGINSEDLRKDLRKLTEPPVILTSIKTFDPDQAFHYFAEAEHSDKTAKKLHHVVEPPKAHTEVFLAESRSHTHLEQQSPRPRHKGSTSFEQPNPKFTRSLTEGTQAYSKERGTETSKFSSIEDLNQSSVEVNVEKPLVVRSSANGVVLSESSKTDSRSDDQIIRESLQSPKQLSPVRKSSPKKRRAPPPPPQGPPYAAPPLKSPARKSSTSSNGKQADITSVSTVNKEPPVYTATGTSSSYQSSAEKTSPGVHHSEPSQNLPQTHKKAAPPPPPVRLPKQPSQRQEVISVTEVCYGSTAQSTQRQSSQSNGIAVVKSVPADHSSQNKGQDKKQGHIQLNGSRDYSPTKLQLFGTQAETCNGDLVGAFTFCVNGKSDETVNGSIDLQTSEDIRESSSPQARNSLSEVLQGRRESTGPEVKASRGKNQAPKPPPSPAHKSPTGRKKAPAPPPPVQKRVKLQDIRGKQKKYDETIEYPVQNTVTTTQLHELEKNPQETSVESRKDSGPITLKHSAEQNSKLKDETKEKNKAKGKYTISHKEKANGKELSAVQNHAHGPVAIIKRIEVARTDTVVEVKHQVIGPDGDTNGYGPLKKVKSDKAFGLAEQKSRMASKGKPRSRVIINLDSGEERDMTNNPQSRPNIKQNSDTQSYSKHAGKADANSGIILISKKNVNHDQTIPAVKESDTYYVPEPAFEHSDDSDLSDVEGSFQATFNPSKGLVTTGETQVSDEEDSGITLVSYQKTAVDDERPAHMPGKRKVKVPSSVSFAETSDVFTDFHGKVDSRSISDQEKTKKLWEKQLLSPDAKLFPDLPHTVKREHNYDHGEFVSTVDSDSIADLASTKKRWEIQAAKYEKEQVIKSPKQKQVTPVTSPVIEKNPAEVAYESAVDREVRLALERERKLREEKHKRFYGESKLLDETENKYRESHDMEVERHTHGSHIEKKTPASPPEADLYNRPSYNELTEADRASPQVLINTEHYSDQDVYEDEKGSQSIIEREIREQAKLEENYRKEKIYKEGQHKNKELEQSEYERQEKEAERISAHESIIDREIREQQQKEASLAREHGWVYHPEQYIDTSGIPVDEPDNQYIPEPVVEPAVAYEPPPPVVQSPPPPAPQTHHRSRGSRTMNHSQEQNSFTNDSNRVQYEDSVITKRPSVGESRIARELREQREREMEVRRTRESAGLQSLSEDHEEVTPFLLSTGMDSSGTLPPEKRTPEAYRETSQVYTSPHPVESPAQMIETPPPAARPSSIGTFTSKQASGPSPQVTPQSSTPSRSLVMPFKDDDDEDEADNADFNKVETPIEREIRLAREREEEFRRAKGLPSPKPVSEKEVVVDVTDGTPVTRRAPVYRKGNEGDNKGTMKKYYSSKLRNEMDAEKMRENDLRKLGKVNTTSEDYVTETRKYQEQVPEGPPVVPNYKKPPTPTSTPTLVKSPVEAKPSPQPRRGSQIQNGVRSPVPEATSPVVNNASPQSTSETYTFRRARNQAETRIERELREMKEREMELRKQRELVGQRNPELVEDDTPVAPPRKSRGARANEWERMHSQTQ